MVERYASMNNNRSFVMPTIAMFYGILITMFSTTTIHRIAMRNTVNTNCW
jgi:hypothetical protein